MFEIVSNNLMVHVLICNGALNLFQFHKYSIIHIFIFRLIISFDQRFICAFYFISMIFILIFM